METNFLKLYLDSNKTLAKTLVVKSKRSIDSINDFIRLKYGLASVDNYDPYSWKYYLNIAGEYHPLDIQMTITSLDTLEDIIFSKANLEIHTATKEEYQYQSRYYYSLLSRYPDQEQLILGILYPADIVEAVEAEDYSILSYPKHLIEPQEITLLSDLELFIKNHQIRWDVQAFGLSDTLYNVAQHAIMYLNILPKLLNLRLKRCKTNEVHSFHIREYLASHGKLDKYLPYLTLKQALYLYRNIRYIERNSGKVEQFKELIAKLLTERRIPITEFSIRHLNRFDEEFYPRVNVRRKPINTQYNVPEKDYFDLGTLYAKERYLVYNNARYLDENNLKISHSLKNVASSITQTKNLESSVIDYNNAIPDTLEAVLLRQWAHMSSHGLYNSIVKFKDPKTSEVRILSTLDAFIYMYYVTLQSIGIEVEEIPVFINLKSRAHPKPSLEYLLEVVDSSISDLPAIATNILQNQPNIPVCLSAGNFYKLAYKLYEEAQNHLTLVSATEDYEKRGMLQNMILRLYQDEAIIFPIEDYNVDNWLLANSLPKYNYTLSQARDLIKNIFIAGTNMSIDDSKSLGAIQKAMLSIMTQLSSYSVQFLRDINGSNLKPLNWAAIRVGNIRHETESSKYVEARVDVIEQRGAVDDSVTISTTIDNGYIDTTIDSISSYGIPIKFDVVTTGGDVRNMDIYFSSFFITAEYDEYDETISNSAKFIAWEHYMALTDEQKNQILSIY